MKQILLIILCLPMMSVGQSYLISIDQSIEQKSDQLSNYLDIGDSRFTANDFKFKTRNNIDRRIVRYSQYIDDIPVVGAQIISRRSKSGERYLGGKYVSSQYEVPKRMMSTEATEMVVFDKSQDLHKCSLENTIIDYQSEVLLPSMYPLFEGHLILCDYYEVKTKTLPHQHYKVYISVEDGSLAAWESKVCEHSVPAKAETNFYGLVDIDVDSVSPNTYVLRDENRRINLTDSTLPTNTDITNDSDYWAYTRKIPTARLDAYYGSQRYYDFMINRFGQDSYDGHGAPLNVVVNNGAYVNAYWSSDRAIFGMGDCNQYNPLVSLDIVAHEFTHGFTQATSNLIYRGESGAINEALSDIFGKAVEYTYDLEGFDWLLGRDILNYGNAFRNMRYPLLYEDPNYYYGRYWKSTESFSDNGGVHTNSSVINFWFQLLVNGGDGLTFPGESYSVNAIGWDNALEIVYETQVAYLTPSSTMHDFYNATLLASQDLFGEESTIVQAVKDASFAVGIDNLVIEDTYDIFIINDRSVFSRYCYEDMEDVQFLMLNYGKDIVSGSRLEVTHEDQGHLDFKVTLTEDWKYGDTISYNGPVNYIIEDPEILHYYFSADVNIILDTNEILKSYAGQFNYNFSEDFINVEPRTYQPLLNCNKEGVVRLGTRNTGCNSLIDGDTVAFKIDYGEDDLWLESRQYLTSNSGVFTHGEVEIPEDLWGRLIDSVDITAYLKSSDGIWEEAGSYHALLIVNQVLDLGEIIDFDIEEDYLKYINTYDNNFFFSNPFEQVGGYFKYANQVWNPNDFDCMTAQEANAVTSETEYSSLSFCIDANNMLDPYLSLDVRQNYSVHFKSDEDREASQVLEVSFGELITTDLGIGEYRTWRNILLPVPSDYSDPVTITMYSQGGSIDFDNIELLEGKPVNVDETLTSDNDSKIYPNPSTHTIYISDFGEEEQEFSIFSLEGKLMQTGRVSEGKPIDIEGLSSGFYILKYQGSESRQRTASFIKMK